MAKKKELHKEEKKEHQKKAPHSSMDHMMEKKEHKAPSHKKKK